MINLVLKDFRYAKKWCLASVIYCIIVPIIIILDGESKVYFLDFLIPLFAVTLPLGKILMAEDTENCREFLKMLPYTWKQRVLGRYLFVFIYIIATEIYVWGIKLFCFTESEASLNLFITEVLVVGIYYCSQLYIYYLKGYYISQFAYVFWVAIGFVLMFAVNNNELDISWFLQINVYIKVVLLLVVVLGFIMFTFKIGRQKRVNYQ